MKWIAIALLMLLAGCATNPCDSAYRVVMPILEAAPVPIACYDGIVKTTCVILLDEDHRRVVRELKSACLAFGGSMESCQAQPATNVNTLSTK